MTRSRRAGSLTVEERTAGWAAAEAEGRFGAERVAEVATRLVGVTAIAAAWAQWALPATAFPGDGQAARGLLTLFFASIGVSLYLFGDRGFRNELRVDFARGELIHVRRNARGFGRVQRRVPLGQVESVFVQRTGGAGGAILRLRQATESEAAAVLRGGAEELEALQRRLCRDLRGPALAGGAALTPAARRRWAEAWGRRPLGAA